MRYTIACKRCHFRAHTTSLGNLGSQLHAHAGGGCEDEPYISGSSWVKRSLTKATAPKNPGRVHDSAPLLP